MYRIWCRLRRKLRISCLARKTSRWCDSEVTCHPTLKVFRRDLPPTASLRIYVTVDFYLLAWCSLFQFYWVRTHLAMTMTGVYSRIIPTQFGIKSSCDGPDKFPWTQMCQPMNNQILHLRWIMHVYGWGNMQCTLDTFDTDYRVENYLKGQWSSWCYFGCQSIFRDILLYYHQIPQARLNLDEASHYLSRRTSYSSISNRSRTRQIEMASSWLSLVALTTTEWPCRDPWNSKPHHLIGSCSC